VIGHDACAVTDPDNANVIKLGQLKMREWKMRYGQKYEGGNAGVKNAEADSRGGKCRNRQAV